MKSASSKKTRIDLGTPVQFLKGVGPKLAIALQAKGISTVRDLLFFFPRDYQDRSKVKPIVELNPEERALIRGQIIGYSFIPIRKLKRPILEARVRDATGLIALKWFHYHRSFFENKFKENPQVYAFGQVKSFGGTLQMIHPELDWDASDDDAKVGVLGVYSESEGLTQRFLRSLVSQALENVLMDVEEDLPLTVRSDHKLLSAQDAIFHLHRPSKGTSLEDLRGAQTSAHRRMIFEEFFLFELVVGLKRMSERQEWTEKFPSTPLLLKTVEKKLPFSLTGDQIAALEKIYEDLRGENDKAFAKPMTRLLQGDVGCGKTLVALCSILPIVAAGAQVAFLVPTEVLAEQHLNTARNVVEGLSLGKNKLSVRLLVGSTSKSEREEILKDLALGKIHLIIGTHALLEDPVQFKNLGLIIIDEQHRFGVDQRARLRAKGNHPHFLSLTATPIPRTLAMTAYGDLDVSIIREMPKGRPDVYTKTISEKKRDEMYALLRKELQAGRQGYVIYPLIEESEKIDLANAVSGAEHLANGPLKDFRVGLLHGRMKADDKKAVMDLFKKNKVQVLVSTTVVEVGVDVPNATVLVIENAERFGLSQLHQLRGRIGRGKDTSHCFLVTSGSGDVSYQRLKAMEQTRDGFKLAELDLEIRGPGDFLGTRQSGDLQFKIASLVRDQFILHEARQAAFQLLKEDPGLQQEKNASLRTYMERAGFLKKQRFESV